MSGKEPIRTITLGSVNNSSKLNRGGVSPKTMIAVLAMMYFLIEALSSKTPADKPILGSKMFVQASEYNGPYLTEDSKRMLADGGAANGGDGGKADGKDKTADGGDKGGGGAGPAGDAPGPGATGDAKADKPGATDTGPAKPAGPASTTSTFVKDENDALAGAGIFGNYAETADVWKAGW